MAKDYKSAKIYRGTNGLAKEKWFVFYSYINPSTGAFERIKVYEGINEYKELEAKEKFAKELVKEIDKKLVAGYSPFLADELDHIVEEKVKAEILLAENPKSPLITAAFKEYLQSRYDKDLEPDTIRTYESYIGKFENYLVVNQLADVRLDIMDTMFVKDMLSWLHIQHEWNGTTYNNHLNYWIILIKWFARKPRFWVKREDFDIGKEGEIEHKSSNPMKNQYFVDTVASKVKEAMVEFPKVLFFSRFIYFSCMRPDEIRNLIIENVDVTGRYIKIVGKTKSRTIPICDELAEMITSLKLRSYPSNYYVLGKNGEVHANMHSENFYTGVFREKIRKPLGISNNYTLYGWKHTRVVDLLNAGYSDAEIMNLTGHKDTDSYDKYKRDLVNHIQTRLRGKTIGWKD